MGTTAWNDMDFNVVRLGFMVHFSNRFTFVFLEIPNVDLPTLISLSLYFPFSSSPRLDNPFFIKMYLIEYPLNDVYLNVNYVHKLVHK